MDLFPGSRLDVRQCYIDREPATQGRHKDIDIYQMIDINYGLGEEKIHRYGELLGDMIRDQGE